MEYKEARDRRRACLLDLCLDEKSLFHRHVIPGDYKDLWGIYLPVFTDMIPELEKFNPNLRDTLAAKFWSRTLYMSDFPPHIQAAINLLTQKTIGIFLQNPYVDVQSWPMWPPEEQIPALKKIQAEGEDVFKRFTRFLNYAKLPERKSEHRETWEDFVKQGFSKTSRHYGSSDLALMLLTLRADLPLHYSFWYWAHELGHGEKSLPLERESKEVQRWARQKACEFQERLSWLPGQDKVLLKYLKGQLLKGDYQEWAESHLAKEELEKRKHENPIKQYLDYCEQNTRLPDYAKSHCSWLQSHPCVEWLFSNPLDVINYLPGSPEYEVAKKRFEKSLPGVLAEAREYRAQVPSNPYPLSVNSRKRKFPPT
jgi:hypothetical protein